MGGGSYSWWMWKVFGIGGGKPEFEEMGTFIIYEDLWFIDR